MKFEQAIELSYALAERSAAGCTVKLKPEPIKEYLPSNFVLMKNMIADGYAYKRTLERRIHKVQAWLGKLGRIPTVAEYAENMGVINKDSSQIYQYLNFDKLEEYAEVAKGVTA